MCNVVVVLFAGLMTVHIVDLFPVYNLCVINPLNTELNPNCHLLALLGAHHILKVGRIRVNSL